VNRPTIPSIEALERANLADPGSARRVMEQYYAAYEAHEARLDREHEAALRYQAHIQRYRYVSVAFGSLLAAMSLGVCAFGIHQKAEILPLAYILGPVAGLAGVFVWGIDPNRTRRKSHRQSQSQSQRRRPPALKRELWGGYRPAAPTTRGACPLARAVPGVSVPCLGV
jgi:hypothetical protein